MAMPMSRKLIIGVCSLIFIIICELYALSLHFETRAKVFRAHFVVLVQVFLYLVSKFLWKNLSDFQPATISSICSSASTANSSAREGDRRETPTRHWTAWKSVLLCYFGLCHCSYLTNLFLMGKDPHWFAMLTYCALGCYLQLATALVILMMLNFGMCCITWRSGGGFSRTMFSKRSSAVLAILYAVCAAFYGLTSAAQLPKVKNVSIPVKDLSNKWDGTHIVQISDIHLGPTVGYSKLSAIVDVINELNPDLVVITGDLVDGSVKTLSDAAAPLSRIKSAYGNFFVTGNHEYYTGDVDNWFVRLKELGFTSLHNSNVKLTPSGGATNDIICLAGSDDIDANKMAYTGHGFDADRTLETCDPQKPVILLAHQPRAAKTALDSSYRVDLVLSGHTHGGQFFPMIIGAYFINPFFAGLYSYGDHSHVYVSQGTQYWGIPMRLGSTMEITHITLRTAPS